MMLVRRNNYSNWLNDWFDNCFFNTEEVPQTRTTTAPAINVKETCGEYIMEVAVPGLKKEWVRINVTNEGLLHMAIENKMEHKEEDRECNCRKERHERYLPANSPMATTSKATLCLTTWSATKSRQALPTAFLPSSSRRPLPSRKPK